MSRHGRFARVRVLRRGYHRGQVDAFLDRLAVAQSGGLPPMSAAEVRQAGFELVHRGYVPDAVDTHLDVLEQEMLAGQTISTGRRGRPDPVGEAEFLRSQLTAPYMKRFPRAGGLRRGYHQDDVDDFVDRVLAMLDGPETLTADEVRRTGFRPRRAGYREGAVDDAMDRVVEHLMHAGRSVEQPGGTTT